MTEEHPNLAAALVAALAGLSVVEKGRTATVPMKAGGNYSYDYADLGDVVKLTRPELAKHGLVALTPIEEHNDGLKCTVVLLHQSGERLDFGPFPFPRGHDAQATGSAVTYYRRYALVSALGMAAGEDDDGATAAPAPARQEAPAEPAPAPHRDAASAIAIIKNLTPEKLEACTQWWGGCDLPLSKAGKPDPRFLDDEQMSMVLEFLRDLDTAVTDGEWVEGRWVQTPEGMEFREDGAEPAGAPVVAKTDEDQGMGPAIAAFPDSTDENGRPLPEKQASKSHVEESLERSRDYLKNRPALGAKK